MADAEKKPAGFLKGSHANKRNKMQKLSFLSSNDGTFATLVVFHKLEFCLEESQTSKVATSPTWTSSSCFIKVSCFNPKIISQSIFAAFAKSASGDTFKSPGSLVQPLADLVTFSFPEMGTLGTQAFSKGNLSSNLFLSRAVCYIEIV